MISIQQINIISPSKFVSTCLLFILTFELSQIVSGLPKDATPSGEHRLMKVLFHQYDTAVRPRFNSSDTVDVRIRFSLQQINDLDEKRQILKMSGWLTAEWVDEFLVWNPEDYGGLTAMVIDPTRMWVPKLAIGNSANKLFDADHYKRFWITVWYTGHARWQPGGVFAIACALDMNFYPFDDQKCTMEIETWVYTADKVSLNNSMSEVGLDTYVPHGEWTIIKTRVYSVNIIYRYYLTESFPEVYCTIYIRRKYTFYFMYILLPCLMLSGVLLMIFLLPADSGEKVSLGVSVLVAISVFLLLVAGNVPDTSDAIPIIAIYLTYFMMVTTLSVALSVLVVKVHFNSPEHPPPQWVRAIAFGCMARITCMSSHVHWYRHYGNPTARRKRKEALTAVGNIRRDVTWSEAATESIKLSRSNSPGGFTPEGTENIELLHQRRRVQDYDNDRDGGAGGVSVRRNSTNHCCRHSAQHHTHSVVPSDGHPVSNLAGLQSRAITPGNKPIQLVPAENEWRKIAEILDRFFFWLFLVCLIVPTTCILGLVRLFKPAL